MTLHAERITAGYGQTEVLRNLSLAASAGDVLALAGPNGVGKTTLLRALSRVLRPQQGTVLIHERDLWAMSTREAARRIGLVAQNETMEWPLTVEQVVALGRTAHRGWFLPLNQADRGAIERAMSQTGLTPLRERMVPTLSGGERQRVLIARALAQEPESLLLDEPTAHLDLRYQGRVLDLVYQLAHEQGMTVVVSLHDLNLVALYADRVALLTDGKLLAVGSPEETLTPANLERAYGVRVSVTRHPLFGTPLVAPVIGDRTGWDDREKV